MFTIHQWITTGHVTIVMAAGVLDIQYGGTYYTSTIPTTGALGLIFLDSLLRQVVFYPGVLSFACKLVCLCTVIREGSGTNLTIDKGSSKLIFTCIFQ
jgi:hypothetical protein